MIDEVIDAMEHAVYTFDVQHIVLDNLQFMLRYLFDDLFSVFLILPFSGQGSKFDKFEIQDTAIIKLREFSTSKDVHITLVVHPRKEQEETQLTISSVFGSAKVYEFNDTIFFSLS